MFKVNRHGYGLINKMFSVLLGLSILSVPCVASISVTLEDPKWEFIIKNQPIGDVTATLASSESGFAKQIQPLLEASNHKAILIAFNSRDIEKDSAALRQLRGQVLLILKQYDSAELALKSALKLKPDLAIAHRSLSMVYMLKKNHQKARTHLQRSVELGVADAQTYGQLAYVNLQLEQSASAVAGYQYALMLEPDSAQWKQGLLYALIASHAFSQAQALVEEMLQDNEKNANLWLQRAQIALKQGRTSQAIASLEIALQLGSSGIDNIVTTAQLHIQGGSPQRAVELLKGNMSKFLRGGDARMDVVDQIANWLVYERRWSSLTPLLTSLSGKSSSLSSYYRSRFDGYRAHLAMAKGDKLLARKKLASAIKADPANGEAVLMLATVLREQAKIERALLYYVRAQALPEFTERALLGRAQLEIDRQNYTEALRLMRQVLKANPSRSDVMSNILALESLVRNQT